jgi:catechol 2,3-dioxygenase-like lactoylglutathione lyase family enzyme
MYVDGLTPILNVSSLEETFTWFEKLGWKKHWEYGEPPNFGAVITGKTEIFLALDTQGTKSEAVPTKAWDRDSGGFWMTWWIPSRGEIQEAYEHALANGITVTLPPQDMPWGMRECHIRHPDGHTFRLSCGIPEE